MNIFDRAKQKNKFSAPDEDPQSSLEHGRQCKVALQAWQHPNKYDSGIPTDIYTLVIGNEVNHMNTVFKNNVYHFKEKGEIGHSFLYVTKNGIVYSAFSFGPLNHYSAYMPGTTDLPIKELFRFYRFDITEKQAERIKEQVDIFKGKINAPTFINKPQPAPFVGVVDTPVYNPDKIFYFSMNNITCTYSTQHILNKVGISMPQGRGAIDLPGDPVKAAIIELSTDISPTYDQKIVKDTKTPIKAVNPYQWYHELSQIYGEGELYDTSKSNQKLLKDGITFQEEITIKEGTDDPLKATGQTDRIQHLR